MAICQQIAVDVVTAPKRTVLFPPTKSMLRSELRTDKISGVRNIPSILSQIGGVLPGHRIEVDTKKGEGRIVDLMHEPGNKELGERLKEAIKAATEGMPRDLRTGGSFSAFSKEPKRTFRMVEDAPHNLATWLYWLRRLLDTGKIRVEKGEIPEMGEIRKLGIVFLSEDRNIRPREGQKPFNYLYPEESAVAVGV